MAHHDDNDDCQPPSHNEGDQNEELYARDLHLSLTDRLRSVTVGQANDTSNDIVLVHDASDERPRSEARPASPPFEPPPEWAAIEIARAQRIANEEADAMELTGGEACRLGMSLLYRRDIIDAAMVKTLRRESGCVIPKQWHITGLRADLVRYPRLLERYLHQESQIQDLIEMRMSRIAGREQESDEAKYELAYLRKQMSLRRQSDEAGETTTLIADMLTNMLDHAISDITNNIGRTFQRKRAADIPPILLDIINKDQALREQLATLKEVECEQSPRLFEQAIIEPRTKETPSPQPKRALTPVVEIPSPPSPQPSPCKSDEPPPSLTDVLYDTENMVKAGQENHGKDEENVPSMPSANNEKIMPGLRKDLCAWLGFKKIPEHLQGMKMGLLPGSVQPPVVYMARTSPEQKSQDSKDVQSQQITASQQQTPMPEEEAYHSSRTSDASISSTSSSDDIRESTSNADESSTAQSGGFQASLSGKQSSETAPSTSVSGARQTSAEQSSGNPQTPIRSVIGSTYLTPIPIVTPHQSPVSPNIIQGQGPPASRLSYRLELEKRKSSDGVVQQMRFAEREMLPGETPGESSTSRVNDWLDGADDANKHATDEEMRDAPDLPPASQPESRAESQPEPCIKGQTKSPAGEAVDSQSKKKEEEEDHQEAAEREWNALTEEEKMRRDSAYKSRQGSLANLDGRRR
ncbi:Nn.00g030970.m01.CDS01 [Neocucurbitaria sp. VM-36]